MTAISFSGLFLVAALAFCAPLLVLAVPRLRIPSAVVEILAGVVIGPSLLGWVKLDLPIRVLSMLGLAFLLLLAGLEIDFDRLRGRPLQLAAMGLLASIVIALATGLRLGPRAWCGHPISWPSVVRLRAETATPVIRNQSLLISTASRPT